MNKVAWVFPGQGSQAVGMDVDLRQLPGAQTRFEQADTILGWSIAEICQNEDLLSRTRYTQPCLYVVESILADAIKARGHQPDFVAGHSLGEYVALYTAGVFDFATGLELVKRRAELMNGMSEGMMAALIGCDRAQLEHEISQTPGVVLANDNNAVQVVISGPIAAVDRVMNAVRAKRVVKLNVSGAFHSPLMQEAAAEFQTLLDSVTFTTAQVPVLSNVDPRPTTDATVLKQRLGQQMTGSVRWREISLQLPEEGVTQVIEVGPGNVLTGLIKRTCPGVALTNVRTIAEIPD